MSVVIRHHGFKALDDIIFKINKPLIGKKGVHYQKLLKDWPQIVGEYMGNLTIPMKISSIKQRNKSENVIHIATNNSSVAMEISYHIGVIKEQINVYFGYDYIQHIKLIQAVFTVKKMPQYQQKIFSQDQINKAFQLTQDYEEKDDIKDILVEFAKNIAQRN